MEATAAAEWAEAKAAVATAVATEAVATAAASVRAYTAVAADWEAPVRVEHWAHAWGQRLVRAVALVQ